VWIDNAGKLSVYLINTYSTNYILVQTANTTFADNQAHHFAVSYDGSKDAGGINVYIDGTLEGLNTVSNTLTGNINTSAPAMIGQRATPLMFSLNGTMDDIRVWNRVRTQAEIQANKSQCLIGNEANLIAYYDMQEGTGISLTDKTGHNLNGTMNNMSNASWVPGYVACNSCSYMMSEKATVTVIPSVDISVDNTLSPSISSNQTGATYQWIDCDNANTPIVGETSQTFTAATNGNYAVIVSLGICSDTSACVSINNIGLKNLESINYTVQPNPNIGSFIIKAPIKGTYTIVNELGQIIQSFELNNTNNYSVSMSNFATGIYFVIGTDNNFRTKIVVTK
jgi:hypothetical protein